MIKFLTPITHFAFCKEEQNNHKKGVLAKKNKTIKEEQNQPLKSSSQGFFSQLSALESSNMLQIEVSCCPLAIVNAQRHLNFS